MKKILFLVFACLLSFIFIACEHEDNTCRVTILTSDPDVQSIMIHYNNGRIGHGEGTYWVNHNSEFTVSWWSITYQTRIDRSKYVNTQDYMTITIENYNANQSSY